MYKVDENISIPHVRDITEGTVDVVKLKEALKIWSYLRETANEMDDIKNNWRRANDVSAFDRGTAMAEIFERASHFIGTTSIYMLEQILKELKTNEEVLEENKDV